MVLSSGFPDVDVLCFIREKCALFFLFPARMIKRHWEGVINAATSTITNARAEGINSKIQWIKRMGCGYRNRERFRKAIYFHLGGLDLYPNTLAATHTNS